MDLESREGVWAVVRDGIVENTVVWDGESEWTAPEGTVLVSLADHPHAGIGWDYEDGEFIPPRLPPQTWNDIREQRDRLLAASDWTQVSDAPLAAGEKQAWADYRQTLRDIPQTQDDPDSIVWPEQP